MSKFINMRGQKIGRLTVIKNTNEKKSGSYIWECLCDCGKTSRVSTSVLRSGHTNSCGCYKKESLLKRIQKPFGEASFNSLYNRYKQDAKKRDLTFSLTKEKFRTLTKDSCFYCGIKPYQIMNKSNKECNGTYVYNGIDRIDNKKGYTEENCVTCCGICNRAKDIMNIDELKFWLKNIKNNLLNYEQNIYKIKIKYKDNNVKKLKKSNLGDWIDLYSYEDVEIKKGEFKLIPLGIALQLPKYFEAHIVPRSSTYKNFGVIMSNGIGIVDNSFSGDNDYWFFPAIAMRDTKILKESKICQFRIIEIQPKLEIIEVENLNTISRGGFGSTGIK